MKNSTKIATCCYCGARSMLKLTARDGHELACGSCGAPLHDLKWLKAPIAEKPKRSPSRSIKSDRSSPRPVKRIKHVKRRKSRWKELIEDIWDEIEDIFD